MLHCEFLNKHEKEALLPFLFDLFYENMQHIVPDSSPYNRQKAQWLSEVSPALDKAPRQIVLCYAEDRLAGFIMYYTRRELLMIEEVQIQKAYQHTTVFYALCRFLTANLPADISYIEAYAHKQNARSQKIMQKLGMQIIADETPPGLVYYQGDIRNTKFSVLR